MLTIRVTKQCGCHFVSLHSSKWKCLLLCVRNKECFNGCNTDTASELVLLSQKLFKCYNPGAMKVVHHVVHRVISVPPLSSYLLEALQGLLCPWEAWLSYKLSWQSLMDSLWLWVSYGTHMNQVDAAKSLGWLHFYQVPMPVHLWLMHMRTLPQIISCLVLVRTSI
jgi:hypothetical protein